MSPSKYEMFDDEEIRNISVVKEALTREFNWFCERTGLTLPDNEKYIITGPAVADVIKDRGRPKAGLQFWIFVYEGVPDEFDRNCETHIFNHDKILDPIVHPTQHGQWYYLKHRQQEKCNPVFFVFPFVPQMVDGVYQCRYPFLKGGNLYISRWMYDNYCTKEYHV